MRLKFKLKEKINILGAGAAIIPVLLILLIIVWQRIKIADEVDDILLDQQKANLEQIVKDVKSLCETSNALIQQQVDNNLNVLRDLLTRRGNIFLSNEMVTWKAVNQYTLEEKLLTLPKLIFGSEWLGQVNTFNQRVKIVDEVKDLCGGTVTLFQRVNKEGDMLRIATNVKKLDGNRAISTIIPAVNPDGKPNPVVDEVLKGRTYRGRAFVVNAWYITAYEPIRNSSGEIIGMFYVGIKQEAVESLRKSIEEIKVGKNGNVWVMGGKGDQAGKAIISKDRASDGKVLTGMKDKNDVQFIDSILSSSIGLAQNEEFHFSYKDVNTNDKRIVSSAYFEPWDWIIVADVSENELEEVVSAVSYSLNNIIWWVIIGGFIILTIILTITISFGKLLSSPIEAITKAANHIANGKLNLAMDTLTGYARLKKQIEKSSIIKAIIFMKLNTKDEKDELINSFNIMAKNLQSLIGEVQQSSINLISTANEMASVSKQQQDAVEEFRENTSTAAAATQEISATSNELVRTMSLLNQQAVNTGNIAESGKSGLSYIETISKKLIDTSKSLNQKLNVIKENAEEITGIISTITSVADQTNLLSLNAAIEAEKAGQFGLGFSVVAKEIRRLADQTAIATLDIEQIIQRMTVSVKDGVKEMEIFSGEIVKSFGEITKVSSNLEEIISAVQQLLPGFESVNEGLQTQAVSAQNINQSIIQLNSAAEQTASTLKDFNRATILLNDAVRGLKEELSKFTTAKLSE